MTSAAVSGDAGTLYHIVSDLLDEGLPFDAILFELLIPVEREVGHRWQEGDFLIAEEHAATAALETVVALLAGSFDQPEGARRVVVATAEGDIHSFPSRAVAAHLLFLGYRTTFLGASVLSSDLAEYLRDERPDALVLSCAMTVHLLGARAAIRASHGAGVPVLVGGRGFGAGGVWAPDVGADAWVSSPGGVADVLETWHPDTEAAEVRAHDPGDELRALIERRPSVVAAAYTQLSVRIPNGEQLLAELALLLGALEAALLVDDDRAIADMVEWQKRTLPAHGYDEPDALVAALRSALEPVSPLAAARLAAVAG